MNEAQSAYSKHTLAIAEIPQSPSPPIHKAITYPYAPVDLGVVVGMAVLTFTAFIWMFKASWSNQLKLTNLLMESNLETNKFLLKELTEELHQDSKDRPN